MKKDQELLSYLIGHKTRMVPCAILFLTRPEDGEAQQDLQVSSFDQSVTHCLCELPWSSCRCRGPHAYAVVLMQLQETSLQ